jgi:DNA-directed RNA polymerase subunit RPC12/RpoP
MYQSCSRCGRLFDAKEPFYHLCLDCWKIQNSQMCLRCGAAMPWAAAKAGYRVCSYCANNPPRLSPVRVAAPQLLDEEIVRGAIRLCHPDLHPESRRELANRVTARLNELLQSHRV